MKLSKGDVITTIAVTNLDRGRDFYENKLGLKRAGRITPEGGFDEVLLQVGKNNHVCLYERPEPAGSKGTVCSFEVDDVAATVKDLRNKGIRFEEYDMPEMGLKTQDGVATMGDLKSAWFKDPDGNILAVGNSLQILQTQGQTVLH